MLERVPCGTFRFAPRRPRGEFRNGGTKRGHPPDNLLAEHEYRLPLELARQKRPRYAAWLVLFQVRQARRTERKPSLGEAGQNRCANSLRSSATKRRRLIRGRRDRRPAIRHGQYG